MNRHPLSVIDVPWACPGKASLRARALATPAPKLDSLIRFPRLCPLTGWAGWHDGCDGQDYQRGVSPMPRLGVLDDEFDQLSQGCVGEGQGARRKSFIEAVNHCRLQDRGCVSAQRCKGVITVPSHLASRYMRQPLTSRGSPSPSLKLLENAQFTYPVLQSLTLWRRTYNVTVLTLFFADFVVLARYSFTKVNVKVLQSLVLILSVFLH